MSSRLDLIVIVMAETKPALIPLPGGKDKILKFFGFQSKDGKTVAAKAKSTMFCCVSGCSKPKVPYCGNTTNLIAHFRVNHSYENAEIVGSPSSSSPACPIASFFTTTKPMKLTSARAAKSRVG